MNGAASHCKDCKNDKTRRWRDGFVYIGGCGGRIYKLFRNVKGDHSALPRDGSLRLVRARSRRLHSADRIAATPMALTTRASSNWPIFAGIGV
jgi:hypothetical protein